MQSSGHPSSTRWGAALIVCACAAGAFAADRTFAAILAGMVAGGTLVGLYTLLNRLWRRFSVTPRLPAGASERQRAMAARKDALRLLIPMIPLVVAGWGLAFLLPENGPSIHGLVYFSLPLLLVVALLVFATVMGRRDRGR